MIHRIFRLISCRGCKIQLHKNPLSCKSCGLQPARQVKEELNHFQLFNIQQRYNISLSSLYTKYLQLQFDIHPDKWQQPYRQEAERLSVLVNEAYKVLKDPIKRSQYILHLKGETAQAEVNDQYLEWVLRSQQEIAELGSSVQKSILQKKIREQGQRLESQISTGFEQGKLKQVIKVLTKLRFVRRLHQQLFKADL